MSNQSAVYHNLSKARNLLSAASIDVTGRYDKAHASLEEEDMEDAEHWATQNGYLNAAWDLVTRLMEDECRNAPSEED